MLYAHDTELTLISTTELVNTWVTANERGNPDPVDPLATIAGLDDFLVQYGYSTRTDDETELEAIRALRPRLLEFWTLAAAGAVDGTVDLVNRLLAETDARPHLASHEGYRQWHMHFTGPEQTLSMLMGAEAAMSVSELVRADDLDRLRICAADDCDAVLVDLSRNRSKRFCDTGNCANRTHVAAYRARRRATPAR